MSRNWVATLAQGSVRTQPQSPLWACLGQTWKSWIPESQAPNPWRPQTTWQVCHTDAATRHVLDSRLAKTV